MNILSISALALAALLVSGCAGGLGSGDYERRDARRVYEVKMGVVESIRQVQIEGSKSGIGTAAGAVVGGIAGSAIEKGATRKNGLELTVRLDSGRTIAIVQEDTGEDFRVGDRVRLLESGGEARVAH